MPLIKVAYFMLNFLNLKSFLSNLFFIVASSLSTLCGVFTFFQKTNENKSTSSKVELFLSFSGRNVGLKKSF